MQLQQRYPTAHLLQLPIGAAPVQPLADSPRQSRSRKPGVAPYRLPNSRQQFVTDLLPAYLHLGSLQFQYPLCPAKKIWDTLTLSKGDNWGIKTPLFKRGILRNWDRLAMLKGRLPSLDH